MKRFWKSTALLLALLIAPAMAHCALEAADVVADAFHCADDAADSTAHDEGGCSPCQVEFSSIKAERDGLTVPQPTLHLVHFCAPMQRDATPPPVFRPTATSFAESPAPVWTLHSRHAAPIRAPSFVR